LWKLYRRNDFYAVAGGSWLVFTADHYSSFDIGMVLLQGSKTFQVIIGCFPGSLFYRGTVYLFLP
jgi:hypothetical protein